MVMDEHKTEEKKNLIKTSRAYALDKCLKLLHLKGLDFKVNVKDAEGGSIYYEIEMFGDKTEIEEIIRIAETVIQL